MATMQGITGKLSGKMGTAVFRVREGQQVVTQYNPIVKNPNTEGQQTQRAKFKLMSQLAAIMSPGFGTMSVTTRKAKGKPSQRNAFTQLNFPLVEVTTDDQEVTAKIPMEQLQLTSSFRMLPPFDDSATTAGQDSTNIYFNGIDPIVTTVRVVIVGYKAEANGGAKQAYIETIQDLPVSNGEVEQNIVPASSRNTGDQLTLLAFGLIPSASVAKKIDLDNIHTPADENFISAIKLDQMVSTGLMSETKTVGINITVTE